MIKLAETRAFRGFDLEHYHHAIDLLTCYTKEQDNYEIWDNTLEMDCLTLRLL